MEPQIEIGLSVHNIQLQFFQSMYVAHQGESAKIQWALLYIEESETCALPTQSHFPHVCGHELSCEFLPLQKVITVTFLL